jgi:hypothetical protein
MKIPRFPFSVTRPSSGPIVSPSLRRSAGKPGTRVAAGIFSLLCAVILSAQPIRQSARPPAPQGGLPPDASSAQPKKQIADDSAKLLQLATDLKTEVDKTTKDTLSITVIRKAGEIERLAHAVKERTRPAGQ